MRLSPRPFCCFLPLLLAACASNNVRPDAVAPANVPAAPVTAAQATPAPAARYGGPGSAPAGAPVADSTAIPELTRERRAAFVAEAAKLSGMSAAEVNGWLDQARYQQSIINAITRPAEGKPWK